MNPLSSHPPAEGRISAVNWVIPVNAGIVGGIVTVVLLVTLVLSGDTNVVLVDRLVNVVVPPLCVTELFI